MRILFLFLSRHKSLCFILATVWTLLIFYGCTIPGKDLPPVHLFDHFDKVVHLVFFFIFYILWTLISYKSVKYRYFILIMCFVLGFSIEYYQINYVKGRSFDIWDGIADTIGGLLGYIMLQKTLLVHRQNNIKAEM